MSSISSGQPMSRSSVSKALRAPTQDSSSTFPETHASPPQRIGRIGVVAGDFPRQVRLPRGVPGSLVGVILSIDRKARKAAPVNETARYALIVLFSSAVGLIAVLANRLTERVKIPVPLLVLIGAALAVHAVPVVQPPS